MRIIGKIAVAAAVAGGMLLAAPAANADIKFHVGGFADVAMNGVIDIEVLDNPILNIDNPVEGVLGG